jgi:hypothetical protein
MRRKMTVVHERHRHPAGSDAVRLCGRGHVIGAIVCYRLLE